MKIRRRTNQVRGRASHKDRMHELACDQQMLLRLAGADYHLDQRPLDIHVGRYSERSWAIWVNGELLAVTAYRKGAEQIKALVEEMMAMLMAGEEGEGGDLKIG